MTELNKISREKINVEISDDLKKDLKNTDVVKNKSNIGSLSVNVENCEKMPFSSLKNRIISKTFPNFGKNPLIVKNDGQNEKNEQSSKINMRIEENFNISQMGNASIFEDIKINQPKTPQNSRFEESLNGSQMGNASIFEDIKISQPKTPQNSRFEESLNVSQMGNAPSFEDIQTSQAKPPQNSRFEESFNGSQMGNAPSFEDIKISQPKHPQNNPQFIDIDSVLENSVNQKIENKEIIKCLEFAKSSEDQAILRLSDGDIIVVYHGENDIFELRRMIGHDDQSEYKETIIVKGSDYSFHKMESDEIFDTKEYSNYIENAKKTGEITEISNA